MQLARCQVFASACAFIRFGSLTTAQLAEYDGMGRKSTPFFFYFHHIIHVTSALLASCYHPRCLHQPHCDPHRQRTRRVASYCTTSHRPCECCANNSRSSLIFSLHHICYLLAAGSLTAILMDIVLFASCRIVQLPIVPVSAALTIHEAR